jgi:hypothetical protein
MAGFSINLRHFCAWRPLLLWSLLFLFAPAVQAHEGHDEPVRQAFTEHANTHADSISADPCRDGGGTCCCEDGHCFVAPDSTKLPAVSLSGSVILPPHREPTAIKAADVARVPITFVIDRGGVLRFDGTKFTGKLDLSALEKIVLPLLGVPTT